MTMSRLFSILVSLFILFLVYLWINHITHMDKAVPEVKTEQPAKPTPKKRETREKPKSLEPTTTEPIKEEKKDPLVAEKKVVEKPRTPEKTVSSSTLDGAHLVVAGNFLERANAEKHLKAIKDLGYQEAEILNFEISQYYTVIAGRYEDLAEARRVAKKLKDMHAIDTYVRNGN
jgi:cell division protein FtsN